jgi:GH25 family lysozyme M1 (1,4-beta-N-acetylmuramidase)
MSRPSRHPGPLRTRALGALAVSLFAASCTAALPGDGHEPTGTLESGLHEACAPGPTVPGIDISGYQHPNGAAIDWTQVSAANKFVIIKVTEGTGYVNSYYADDANQARAHGMIVGAYHFLRSNADGTAQADHMIAAMGGSVPRGDLPPMADIEDPDQSYTPAQRAQVVHDFIARLEAVTGRKPMIYSGSWYWGPYLGSPSGYGDGYPKVWSAYTQACPQVPDDFPSIQFWQYSGSGSTAGIQGDVDQDTFYGTLADLQTLAMGKAPDYAGQSLGITGQSYPIVSQGEVTVHVGETATGWVKLTNTGSQSWEPGTVWLAPIPRDQDSPYASPSWQSPTRISTVAQEVPPGQVGQFELDITGHQVGEDILSLGWVAEGVTWFSDSGGPADGYFAVKVKVVEGPPPEADGGPVPADGGSAPADGGIEPPPPPPPTDGGPSQAPDQGRTFHVPDAGSGLSNAGVAGGCSVALGPGAASSDHALMGLLLALGLVLAGRRPRR